VRPHHALQAQGTLPELSHELSMTAKLLSKKLHKLCLQQRLQGCALRGFAVHYKNGGKMAEM